jgi:hypothetical protein
VGLAAALPVIVTAVRSIVDGWVPLADQATIATRAYEVFTAHTPLVGQYSFASRAVGRLTYDPGPVLYWLLALPARFGGAPALSAVMALFNTAAIVGSVALARRRGGLPLMYGSAAAIALMSRSFGSEALHGIWNPSAGLLVLTLMCFVCWSVACGEHRLLPLAAAAASFVVQCHLAYVAPALALLLVAVVGLAIALRSKARRSEQSWRRTRGPLSRSLLMTLVVALVCWSAPLVDQVAHTGNLGRLANAATSSHTTVGARAGWRALTSAVGVPPRFLRVPQRQLSSPHAGAGPLSGGDYGDTRLEDVLHGPTLLAAISCLLALVGLIVVAVVAARRRRGDLVAGAAIGLLLSAAFAWMASATPLQDFDTLGYTLWWGSLVGMWVWLILIFATATLLHGRAAALLQRRRASPGASAGIRSRGPRSRARAAPALVALAALAVLAAVLAAGEPPDAHEPEFSPSRALAAKLVRAVPDGSRVLLSQRGLAVLPLGPALVYELRRRGSTVVRFALGTHHGNPAARPAYGARPLVVLLQEAQPSAPAAIAQARVTLARAPWLPGVQTARSVTMALVPMSLASVAAG